MRKYTKTIVQVVVTVLVALAAVWSGGVTTPELINVFLVAAGALQVFTAPNVPGAEYTKGILAAITAALVALTSVVSGGVAFPELVQIVVAALGAVGVVAFKNVPELGVHE
jgi:peptidoglycan/LPS O-acetylase OafA/YrhL